VKISPLAVVAESPMKNQDDIVTEPVVVKDDLNVTFESVELAPGDRAEIVLSPKQPLRCPTLFMSNTAKESTITIEQLYHGRTAIFANEHLTLEQLRFGKPTHITVTESEPIKIVIVNSSPLKTTVGASLVLNAKPDTTYHLKGKQTAKDKE
jgi:hypothetical protein